MRKYRGRAAFVLAFLASIFAAPLTGAVAASTVIGTVSTADGAGLPGATVTATNEAGVKQVSFSDANGRVRFLNLEPGCWTLTFANEGFSTVTRRVCIRDGRTVDLRATLSLAVESSELIVPSSSPSIVRSSSPAVAPSRTRPLTPEDFRGFSHPSDLLGLARTAQAQRRCEDFRAIMAELDRRAYVLSDTPLDINLVELVLFQLPEDEQPTRTYNPDRAFGIISAEEYRRLIREGCPPQRGWQVSLGAGGGGRDRPSGQGRHAV